MTTRLGDRKTILLRVLRSHRGPANALTAGDLAAMLYGSRDAERTIRMLITELIVADGHGEIIANTGGAAFKGHPPGYFWATDWRQADAYYEVLVSRREDIGHRMEAAWRARQRLLAAPEAQTKLEVPA